MWYRIEEKSRIIYISDHLIFFNPRLVADLCSETLTTFFGISYWELIEFFNHMNGPQKLRFDAEFKIESVPYAVIQLSADIVGAMFLNEGRLVNVVTYFTYIENELYVSKYVEGSLPKGIIESEKVLIGDYLVPVLSDFINRDDLEGFWSCFFGSIEEVFRRYTCDEDSSLLYAESIDCIAKNTIISNGSYDFFDIEFCPDIVLTKNHFLFRSALGLNKKYVVGKKWPFNSAYEIYTVLCAHFKVKEDVEECIENELLFRRQVIPEGSLGLERRELQMGFYNRIPFWLKMLRYLKHNGSYICRKYLSIFKFIHKPR